MAARPPTSDLLELTEAAMAVALSLVLGAMRLVELPSGGSISFGILPLLAFALVRGPRAGILAATCAGFAHALAGGTIVHPVQLLLDYGLAYAVLGLAGCAHARSRLQTTAAVVTVGALQLACSTVSGIIFFGSSLGDHAFAASLSYNAATIVPETILAALLVPGVVRAIARANPAEGWRLGLLDPPAATPRVRRPTAAQQLVRHAPHAASCGAMSAVPIPAVAVSVAPPPRPLAGRPAPFARAPVLQAPMLRDPHPVRPAAGWGGTLLG